MQDDLMWQLFTDTGDPLAWLMCHASEKSKCEPNDDRIKNT